MVALLLMAEFVYGVGVVSRFWLISIIWPISEDASPLFVRLAETLIHLDITTGDPNIIGGHFSILQVTSESRSEF